MSQIVPQTFLKEDMQIKKIKIHINEHKYMNQKNQKICMYIHT